VYIFSFIVIRILIEPTMTHPSESSLPQATIPPVLEPGNIVVSAAQVIKEKINSLRGNRNSRDWLEVIEFVCEQLVSNPT